MVSKVVNVLDVMMTRVLCGWAFDRAFANSALSTLATK